MTGLSENTGHERTCPICGTPFVPARHGPQKYHSAACAYEATLRRKRAAYRPKPLLLRPCPDCETGVVAAGVGKNKARRCPDCARRREREDIARHHEIHREEINRRRRGSEHHRAVKRAAAQRYLEQLKKDPVKWQNHLLRKRLAWQKQQSLRDLRKLEALTSNASPPPNGSNSSAAT